MDEDEPNGVANGVGRKGNGSLKPQKRNAKQQQQNKQAQARYR